MELFAFNHLRVIGKLTSSQVSVPDTGLEVLKVKEIMKSQARLFNYCPKSPPGNISAWMIWDNCSAMGFGVIPDLMTSFGMAVKNKASPAKFSDYFCWFEGRKATHNSTGTGILTFNLILPISLEEVNFFGSGSPCSMQDSIIFRATSSAISSVSAMVRPWAISPCKTELVAKYPPSSSGSMETGIRYSDISITSAIVILSKTKKIVKEVQQWTMRNWAKEIQDEMAKVNEEIQNLKRGLIDKEKYLNRLKSMLKSAPRLMVKSQKQPEEEPAR